MNQVLYKRLSVTGSNVPTNTSQTPTLDEKSSIALPGQQQEPHKDDDFVTPTKSLLRNNSRHGKSQTEFTLLASLEKAKEHIHAKEEKQHFSNSMKGQSHGGASYFTNKAIQERIKAYSREGLGKQVIPTDFFNKYSSEGGGHIGLQRYDSTAKEQKEETKGGGKRRRHSLGAGSFDKDAIQSLTVSLDSEKSSGKQEAFLRPEPTPSKIDMARVDSFRDKKP